MTSDRSLSITGDVSGSVLVTGSQNLIIQATVGQLLWSCLCRTTARSCPTQHPGIP